MKILVIGGTQFVGPAVIETLLQKGHSVSVFNRGNHPRIFSQTVTVYKGDRNQGFGIKDKFDAVVDLCAYNGVQTEQALKGLRFDYFLHMSTAAVYAKPALFPLRENSPLGKWPVWGKYNIDKVACEHILEQSAVAYATLRPVFILGENNICDREHFIYSRIKNNIPLFLPGNGEAVIQFVFVQDVARAISVLVEGKITGAFNCAGDEAVTLNGLVAIMANIMGMPASIQYDSAADQENFKKDEFPFANENFFCDALALKQLGVTFTPLVSGLTADYKNYYNKFL